MHNESFPSPENRDEDEFDEQDQLRWNHFEIRKEAKDLRVIVEQTSEDFPNREKIFRLIDELLELVPVYDQRDEDRDERERKQLAEQIQATAREHAEWKKGTK